MTLPPTAIVAGVLRRLAGRRVLRLGLAEVEVYNTNPYLSLHVTMGGTGCNTNLAEVEVLGVGQRPARLMGGRVCTPLVRTGA
jgi:hypothetical protein